MGKLNYAGLTSLDIDDYPLAHIKVVILAKLRLNQSFSFSWDHETEGRTTIWVNPAVPIMFTFDTNDRRSPNRQWINDLFVSANSTDGMHLMPEPPEGDYVDLEHHLNGAYLSHHV